MNDNIITGIYDALYTEYGNLNWWPADSPYEVIVGAVLTQNTAWGNVEKAISNFNGTLSPQLIENISVTELSEIIRPAGFFNQKSVYLKEITKWYKRYGYDVGLVRENGLRAIRNELLSVKGVGQETADSVLLYAFGLPTFVVDAYTRRLLERLKIDMKLDYVSIKTFFENSLPPDVALFNNYHACIVINAKTHCKVKPVCTDCPLSGLFCN